MHSIQNKLIPFLSCNPQFEYLARLPRFTVTYQFPHGRVGARFFDDFILNKLNNFNTNPNQIQMNPNVIAEDYQLEVNPDSSLEAFQNTYLDTVEKLRKEKLIKNTYPRSHPQMIQELIPDSQQLPQKYNYDMTHYIKYPEARTADAIVFNRIFDSLWKHFEDKDESYPDVPFQDTFNGNRRCLQFLHTPLEIFLYYFKLQKIPPPNSIPDILSSSIQKVVPFLSSIKDFYHKHIDSLPPIAYLYIELATIAGYPKEEMKNMSDNPVEWLSILNYDSHSPQWWSNQIYTVLQSSAKPKEFLSFEQFISSPWLWVTDGAAPSSRLFLDGKKVRSKFGAALSMDPKQLMLEVLNSIKPDTNNMQIFTKPDEKGFKRRLISNLDLGSYLIASYIRYLIESLCTSHPYWMTATTSFNADLNVINKLRNNETAIPLDESQFDHHVSRNAWLGFIGAMNTIFPNNLGVHLFIQLFENTYFIHDSNRYQWLKGMPSGLALTAMCNTLFNYVKQSHIHSDVHFALGDDALIFGDYNLDTLSEFYNSFGSEVNPHKNWKSNQYADYLHFIYTKHGRVGVPARIYSSLIYAAKFTDSTPLQRINEITLLFKDFFDRSCLFPDENLIAADLSRAVSNKWARFNKEAALNWLHIPKAYNGFGLLPYTFKFFSTKDETVEQKYSGNIYHLDPKHKIIRSTFQIRPVKVKRTKYVLCRQRPIKIDSKKEWLDIINGRSSKYSRNQMQYMQETIPLPEIPFISDSRLSLIAKNLGYNAIANAHGSLLARTTRFMLASLDLAAQMVQQLKKLRIRVYV